MNVPKLRFKEFKDDWRKIKLEKLLIESKEKSLGNDNGIVLTSSRKGLFPRSTYFNGREEENTVGYSLVPKNSFTYRQMSDDNTFFINLNKDFELGLVSPEYPVFTTNELLDTTYFANYINDSRAFKQYCQLQKKGGTRTRLYFKVLKELEINIPNIEEQKKIGYFFETINKKIQVQQEKIAYLKKQKQGFMQKIFNQEFRLINENGTYSEWTEHILGEIGMTFTGLSGKTKEDFGYGSHSFITYVNVFNNLFATRDGVEKVNVSEDENQAIVKKGDILLTTSSETPLEVGMASIWTHSTHNLHLNSFCFGYRLHESKDILPEFVAISLRSDYMRKKIILLAQGSTRFNMSKTELMQQTINIPSSFEEQRKIVDFYKSLDTKVSLAQQQLEALQLQKEAFMQQMFI